MPPPEGRIGRYRLTRLLARTDLSEVYLGADDAGQAVCIKRPLPSLAGKGSLASISFRHEARLLAEVRHPNVVRVLEVGEHEGVPFLCLELVEGQSLEQRTREGPVPRLEALEILRQIAGGLAHVHSLRIVHGDLKPGNVLLGGAGPAVEIKLVDFGLASYAGTRRDGITGTPHYMAPEQTGLVDWPVDARTDLYALGVIGFELLTGALPFPVEDPAALLSAHVATAPPSPLEARPDLPPILARLILKLLEKDPERRYRSARGLAHDLGLLEDRLRAGDPSPSFVLDATSDLAERVGQVFIGRTQELAELESLVARVKGGRPAAAFVGGTAGVGKSALLHALQNRAVTTGVWFAAGKCYEFARALPYHVLVQALTDHLSRLESAPARIRDAVRARVTLAVGELGAELVQIAPAFARWFPDAGAPVYLGEGRDRVRFLQVLTRLFEAIAPPEAPLVVLLDDLQWADAGSLGALEAIADGARDASLLVLGTFRSEEVDEGHPLRGVLDRARRGGARVVDLRPLRRPDTALLVAESLRQPVSALPAAVVDRIYQRTEGNPLFVSEVVKALLASGALALEAGQLRTDLGRLEATELPSTIVDVVLRRVRDLDAKSRRVLGTAALIGTGFSLGLLASAADLPGEEVFASLETGVAQRILQPPRQGVYRFHHDRMQEACARLLEGRVEIHRRIVDHLEREAGEDARDEVVFALAEHAERAGDPARAARYCRAAATRALARHASQQALDFYEHALEHAAQGATSDADRRAMREQVAEILTLLGRYDEARAAYEELLAGASLSPVLRARLLSRLGGCKQRAGDHGGAREALTSALTLLGLRMPERPSWLSLLGARLRWAFARARAALSAPLAADERRAVVLDTMVRLWILLFMNDARRVPYISYRLLAEAEPLGPSRELSRALRHLTVALALLERPAFRAAVRHGQRAVEIARRIGEPLEAGVALLYTADIFCWSARYREALPWLDGAREALSALGNMWELANAHIFSYMAYRGSGRLDEAMAHAQALLELGERLGASGTIANGHQKVAEILLLRGDRARAESHLGTSLELAEARKLRFERFQGYKIQASARLLDGRFAEARALYASAVNLCEVPGVSFFQGYVSDAYLGYAEAFLKDADYFAAAGGLAGEEGRRVGRYVAQRLARERHLLGHLGYALRVRGLLLSRAQRHRASRRAFLRAIEVLDAQERAIDAALARIDAAAALGARHPAEALGWLRSARAVAERHRLKPILARCDEALRDLGHEVTGAPAGSEKALHALRELVGTGQLLMQALDPELLLERIADASLALLGAERAFVFIREEGGAPLAFRLGKSADGRRVGEEEASVSRGVIARVDATGEGLAVSDTEQDQTLRERRSVQAYQVRSVLCAPLRQAGQPLGVLYLDSQITRAIFGPPELDLLQSFAVQAAAALGNAVQFATIERMNRELDAKVLERTRELEAANLKLEASMAELTNTTLRLVEAEREALEKELEVARRIQLSMVPERRTHGTPAARFAGVVEPASLCGGDLWTFAEAAGDKLVLFIGDVTGHGAGAAMITTVAKSCLDTMWLEHAGRLPLGKLCATMNEVIARLGRGELFMTAFVVEIDPARRALTYCSAGHNPQLLVRSGGARPEAEPLFERGLRLGDASGADFAVKTATYAPGDWLVLYTDGLIDRSDGAGVEFGIRRLRRALCAPRAGGPGELLDAVLGQVRAHAGETPAEDDVTLVVAELL